MDAPSLHILADAAIAQLYGQFAPRRSIRLQQRTLNRLETLAEVANVIYQEEFQQPQAAAVTGAPVIDNNIAFGDDVPKAAEENNHDLEKLDKDTMDRLAREEIVSLDLQRKQLSIRGPYEKADSYQNTCKLCRRNVKGRTERELIYGLKRHYQIHVKDKPFKCSICNFTSTQKSNLKTHCKVKKHRLPAEVARN